MDSNSLLSSVPESVDNIVCVYIDEELLAFVSLYFSYLSIIY